MGTPIEGLKIHVDVDVDACHGKKKNLPAKRKRLTAKRITSRQKENDSRQKEKPQGKKNNLNLTAKEIRIKMFSRHRRNFAVSLFLFAVRLFFLP